MASTPDPTNPLPIADPPLTKDTTGDTLVVTNTYLGTATAAHPNGTPDVFLAPPLPSGRLYYLTQVLATAAVVVEYPWEQGNFLYDKVLNGKTPEAWTPNLDTVGKLSIPANFLGTIVGGGGANKPKSAVTWKDYALPIPSTSSIQIQLGSGLGLGNSLALQYTYVDGGPCTELKWTQSIGKTTGFTDDDDPVPAGYVDLVETAFIKANQKYSGGISSQDGLDLASHPLTGKGSGPTQSTGGYGNDQCSGEQKGTFIVWTEYQKAVAGDHLIADELLSAEGIGAYMTVVARQVA